MSVITDLIDENSALHRRITELEAGAESLMLTRDYHHEQEIEYRRRWAEVSAKLSAAKETISRYETTAENCDLLRAELAAMKAQEPVAWAYKEYVWVAGLSGCVWRAKVEAERPNESECEIKDLTPLYAAPVVSAERQVSIPDGWQMVPVRPTSNMTWVGQSMRYESSISIGSIYCAMLAAAPTPSTTEGQP